MNIFYLAIMVNKCVAYGCKLGMKAQAKTNRPDWTPSSNSVLCQNHFEDKFIIRRKRNKLRWDLNPVPTIHSNESLKRHQ